jgi:HEAT repeat protein
VGVTAAFAAQAADGNLVVALFAEIRKSRGIPAEIEKKIQPAMESIPSLSTSQVNDAMPAILTALDANDERVQALAAFACFAIVRRPDGNQLLAGALPALVSLLESPSEQVTSAAVLVLVNSRIALRPDLVSSIVAVIRRRDRRAAERIPALATAVASAPKNAAVSDAVIAFMLEPLDAATKVSALRALRASLIDSAPMRLEAIAWLQDSDAQVKLGVIALLTRIGPQAVAEAKFDLEWITQREDESREVRAAAAKALETLR